PGTIGYDASLPDYAYDPERAKELLKEAGYNGELIKVGGPHGRYSMDKQVTEAIGGMLAAVGINVSVETLAMSSYFPKFMEPAYDLGLIGWTDFTINPNKHWSSYFYSPLVRNGYSNAEMDAIISAVDVELDDTKAAELLRQGQALQHKEFGGALPLYYEPQLIGVSAKYEGFVPR
ncbi:ABC transporter substrate-binding protein, partial [Oceanibium sediminis]|uniref:ABC transporter substrate-binding protein n=1 Tax=Oceanibium sediminis TaxID=2026339 RepID=UPI001E623CA1